MLAGHIGAMTRDNVSLGLLVMEGSGPVAMLFAVKPSKYHPSGISYDFETEHGVGTLGLLTVLRPRSRGVMVAPFLSRLKKDESVPEEQVALSQLSRRNLFKPFPQKLLS